MPANKKKQEQAEKLLASTLESKGKEDIGIGEEQLEETLETEEALSEDISVGDVEGFLSTGMPEMFEVEAGTEGSIEETLGLRTGERADTGTEEKEYVREEREAGAAGSPYTARTGEVYSGAGITEAEVPYGATTEAYEGSYETQYSTGIPTLAEADRTLDQGELARIVTSFGAAKGEAGQPAAGQQIERYVGRVDVARDLLDWDTTLKKRLQKEFNL